MSRFSAALAVVGIAIFPAVSPAKKLPAPRLTAPAAGATVEAFPAFVWNPVKHADRYQVQIAADARFASPLGIFGSRSSTLTTTQTAATASKSASDGTYHWRVRALRPNGDAGRWSTGRTLTKAWTTPPALSGADALSVVWPSQPLQLAWSAVPHAVKYQVQIATDPGMTNLVVGSKTKPFDIFGTTVVFPSALPSGRYYWNATPVDAEGFKGQTSAVHQFDWAWPTSTTLSVSDLDPDPRRFDPQFSWTAIPGAASYEVEVNADQSFAPNSKWCCSDKVTGTSLSPKELLANNNYYARVRGIDVDGNAGQWNVLGGGATFSNNFDDANPSIPHLRLGEPAQDDIGAGTVTQAPVVRWDPVAGAHEYEVETAPFNGTSCDYSGHGHTMETATTSWTPLGSGSISGFSEQIDALDPDAPGSGTVSYCLQVRALTDNDSLTNKVQVSPWTELKDDNGVAFQFQAQADPGPTLADTASGDYLTPQPATGQTQTPLFTWKPVAGARSYFVVIARDPNFTNIADAAITEIPAYAPRQRSLSASQAEPLTDETTSYYWVVFPSAASNASGINTTRYQANSYRSFDKSSVPPTALGPQTGSDVATQPTFRWTDAEGARDYRLQVGTDPTFSNLIEDVTTDSTAYTTTLTYPADTTLYWRVRGNDTNNHGLNWSATGTFTRRLPIPSFLQGGSPTSGTGLPVFAWGAVDGAVGYSIHADNGDGTASDISTESTAFSPKEIWGTGLLRYKVRALFPSSSGGKVGGPYTALQPFTRLFGPVTHVNALRSKSRVLLSWDGYSGAKSYRAAISTTDSFDHTIASVRTDGTVWAPDLSRSPGGRLYYRVAPVDTHSGEGAEATGSFTLPKVIRVSVSGVLIHGRASRVTIVAKDGRGRAVQRGRVTITGAGLATRRLRLSKRGKATATLRPRKRGPITFLVRLKGYIDGSTVRSAS